MITAPAPAGMMKMASGRIVPMSRSPGSAAPKVRKLLICLQYYAGDQKEAEDLGALIAELERTRCHIADVMVFARFDAPEFSPTVHAKLATKFDKVISARCKRMDGVSYPYAANNMFHDLVNTIGQPPLVFDYYAFLNLEPDAVPIRPGWIAELANAYQDADRRGLSVVGHIENNPRPHVNGVALYASDISRRTGKHSLLGCSPNVCFDIAAASVLLPHAEGTDLIAFKYRHPTITPEALYASDRVVLYHGTKDGSARAAVRARHVTMTENRPVAVPVPVSVVVEPLPSPVAVAPVVAPPVPPPAPQTGRRDVYTYFVKPEKVNPAELTAITAAWRQGWISRGWNPVVLTLRDAAKHLRFDEVQTAIGKLPYVGSERVMFTRFNRWLALDTAGGGLLVDLDVIPGAFTPQDVIRNDVGLVLSPEEGGSISAAIFDAPNLAKFIAAIVAYDPQPGDLNNGKPEVTDLTVFLSTQGDFPGIEPTVVDYGSEGSAAAKLIRFVDKPGKRKSAMMEEYLRGAV